MNILFVTEDLYNEYLTIMSLSSVLKKFGYGVGIVEARYDSIKRKLQGKTFSVLVIILKYLGVAKYYLDLNLKIKKEFNIFSVFGGMHINIAPEIINETGVDGVYIGDGERALLELVNNLSTGKLITDLRGWWIKKDGKIFRNPEGPSIKDLDSLPFIDRTLFYNSPVLYIMAGKGCPFRCSYCIYRYEYRCRSVDNVIEELRQAKAKTHVKFVIFEEPIFNTSLSWVREFSGKYKKEIGLPFHCAVRADSVTPEYAECLKEAGCFAVTFGIETGNDYVRNQVLKKGLTRKDIISAAAIIKKHKIRLRTTNMLGIPFTNLEDDLETLKLNIQLRTDFASPHLFFVHKNTDIYDSLVQYMNPEKLKDSYGGGFYIDLESKSSVHKIRKIKNLEQLFSITVECPFILPFVPFLIKLPFYKVYLLLNIIWTEYCLYFRMGGKYTLGWRWLFCNMRKIFNERPQEIFKRIRNQVTFSTKI